MNDYAVVKVQAKGEHSERMPFTYRPETAGVSTLCRKIFLSLAIARFMDLATA